MSFAFISIKKKQSLQALEVDSSQTDEKLAFSAKGNYQHIESNTHNIFVILMDRLEKNYRLLPHVVHQKVLDQL